MAKPTSILNKGSAWYACFCGTRFLAYESQVRVVSPSCSRRCGAIQRTGFRSVNLDDGYFSRIDTHNKAYVLGLLFADGSVRRSLDSWVIDLHEDDEPLLVSVAHDIGLFVVGLPHSQRMVRLEVRSDSHCQSLVGYGCVPNKTYEHVPVRFPRKEFEPSFWRGFFDGDGSVTCDARSGCYRVKFTCSQPFLIQRLETIAARLGVRYLKGTEAHASVIYFSGPHAQVVALYLQTSPGLRLHRKSVTCQELISRTIRPCVRERRRPTQAVKDKLL